MTQGSLSNLCWLISRASGVIGIALVSLSVMLGLAMAAKVIRDPARRRAAVSLHEDLALVALVAVAIHGVALLGDTWLRPGLAGITIPFQLSYRPAFTGVGVIAGYLMLLLGPSFYLRRRIGTKRWRSLHRLAVLIWPLAAVHTLGSGSDAAQLWLRVVVLLPLPALAYLIVVRVAHGRSRGAAAPTPAPARLPARSFGHTSAPAHPLGHPPAPARSFGHASAPPRPLGHRSSGSRSAGPPLGPRSPLPEPNGGGG